MTAVTPGSEISPTAAPERSLRWRVDLDAVVANYKTFQSLAPGAQAAAVVKADAYGLGAARVARALSGHGCGVFFTATPGEAARVRAALDAPAEIIVLNGLAQQSDLDAVHAFDLTPCLNSLEDVKAFLSLPSPRAPALHIDTGMNRLGLRPEELGEALQLLAAGDAAPAPDLVMSHLACASDPSHPLNEAQRTAFAHASRAGLPKARLSLAASAGAQLGPGYHFDMIRIGIGLYGWDGMDAPTTPLKTAAFLEAPVLQIRTIRAGETCGYGATYTAPHDVRAAVVAAGYADGLFRAAAGRGYCAFGSTRMALLGRISMDLAVFDASCAPDLRAGDHVELLGERARLCDVASAMGTLPYEVLTGLMGRASR